MFLGSSLSVITVRRPTAQQCCTLCVVDDLEPLKRLKKWWIWRRLTDAERKLLEAVQTGGLCDLSQDDETDRTVRAAVLKAILSGEGEAGELAPER